MAKSRNPEAKLKKLILRELNRQIDKHLHKYFDHPTLSPLAITADTLIHQITEYILGLPPKEIRRRTRKYLPKAIERSIKAQLRKVRKPQNQ